MRPTGSGRAGDGSDRQFCREYGGTSGTLRNARTDVIGWLELHGLDENLIDRAALVVSELATNAVQSAPGSDYGVQMSLGVDRSATISVTSHTTYEQPPPREHWRPVSLLAPRGRGLLIVSELAQDVDVDLPSRNTVVVTATLR